jgi:hypothetical protein
MSVLAAPFAGIGITLGAKPSGTGSFVPLVQIKDDMEFDGFDTTVINVPTLASTTMTKIPGRTDFGTLNCSMYLVNSDAGVADIMTLAGSKATVPWQVQLPDGTSPHFSPYCFGDQSLAALTTLSSSIVSSVALTGEMPLFSPV